MITKFGLIQLAHSLPLATRPDVRDYFNNALVLAQNLMNKIEDQLAKKGIAGRPPYAPVPDRVDYTFGAQNSFIIILNNKDLSWLVKNPR